MQTNTMEDLTIGLPPIEIRFSDLGIAAEHPYCRIAVRALFFYWAQATLMTNAEQREYYDLLVTRKLYIWDPDQGVSDHEVWQQMDRGEITWPRYLFLYAMLGIKTTVFGNRIKAKYKVTKLSCFMNEYKRYHLTTEVPMGDDNVDYVEYGEFHPNVYAVMQQSVESDAAKLQSEDQAGHQAGHPQAAQPTTEVEVARILIDTNFLVGPWKQSSASAKQRASAAQGCPEEQQRVADDSVENQELFNRVEEEMSWFLAQNLTDKMIRALEAEIAEGFGVVRDALIQWAHDTVEPFIALCKSTNRMLGEIAGSNKYRGV